METLFQTGFAGVRIHNEEASHSSAAALGAKAYTSGQDIHFGAGQFRPEQPEGLRLLAHELSHTIQQRAVSPANGSSQGPLQSFRIGARSDALEQEADSAADQVISGRSVRVTGRVGNRQGRIQRTGPGNGGSETDGSGQGSSATPAAPKEVPPVEEIVSGMAGSLTNAQVKVGAPGDPECGSRAGYVRGYRIPIVLCPGFFDSSPEQQSRTMIHESAHLQGIGSAVLGEGYCQFFTCESSCPGGFDSADSWAQYVHCLTDQTPDEPEKVEVKPGAQAPGSAPSKDQ